MNKRRINKSKRLAQKIARKSKKGRMSRHVGSGILDVVKKYTVGEKRAELIPQMKSIYEGLAKGYGITGIGGWTDFAWDNGGSSYLLTVPLASIILWHPVRGKGERAQAGPKTTQRADSMYNVLINAMNETKDPSLPVITYSRKHPLTFAQLNSINGMASDDNIKISPVNILDNTTPEIDQQISEINLIKDHIENPDTSENGKRILRFNLNKLNDELQDMLYKQKYSQYFLVLSGQGRLQAIIEAVKNARIPPDQFFIQLECKDIYLDICNVLIKIHNDWVSEGLFEDTRHEMYIDGQYIPMSELNLAFSCSKYRNKKDTECYVEYKNVNKSSENVPCSNIYNYRLNPINKKIIF